MNLNDTPSGGPLTSEDLDWWRRADMLGVDIDRVHKRPYIPAGCDQQGRIEPAEACTDMGMCGNVGSEGEPRQKKHERAWAVIVFLLGGVAFTFAYLAFAS